MNKIKKIATLSTIATIGIAGYASAAAVPISDNPNSPQSVKICKTITNVYDATTATFDYTFTAQSTGLTGVPSTQSIVFTNAAHTNNEVSKCIDVDISGVTFADNSPKQVEVEVAETAVNGYSPDTTKYTLLFDLRNTVDGNNNVTGQVATAYLHNSAGAKVTQFDYTSAKQYGDQSILLSKTVKGSAADTNKYFKFTVNVSGTAGTTYTVNGAAAGSGSAASCTANTDCIVYLKGGDTVRIGYTGTAGEIPVGETWTVTEDTYSDYTTTVATGTAAATSARTTGQQTILNDASSNTAAFTNTKDSTTPTGIFLNLWPYILLGAISVGAVVYGKKAFSNRK